MTATTLWHDANQSWLDRHSVPPTHDLLIQSVASLVSTGTERLAIRGELPPDADQTMSVPYMQGSFKTAFTYGYSLVGKVIDTAPTYTRLSNALVHVMHPHATHASVGAEAVTVLPPTIDPARAALLSTMETVVNACWDSGVAMGDTVVIFGFGLIGNLLASVIRAMPGVKPVIHDHDPARLDAAKKAGFDTLEQSSVTAYDIAFNTTSHSDALQHAINITTTDGRVIELSWYGQRHVTLDLGAAFHYGRKRIISSQVSRIPAHLGSQHNYTSRKALCLELLEDPAIALADNNSLTMPFDQAAAHFNALRTQSQNLPAVILEY